MPSLSHTGTSESDSLHIRLAESPPWIPYSIGLDPKPYLMYILGWRCLPFLICGFSHIADCLRLFNCRMDWEHTDMQGPVVSEGRQEPSAPCLPVTLWVHLIPKMECNELFLMRGKDLSLEKLHPVQLKKIMGKRLELTCHRERCWEDSIQTGQTSIQGASRMLQKQVKTFQDETCEFGRVA